MNSQSHASLAVAAVASILCGVAVAQTSSDGSTSTSVTTATTTATNPSANAPVDASKPYASVPRSDPGTLALPTTPSTQAPVASGASTSMLTTQSTADANAPIGSTPVTRSDSASEAFEKLAPGRAFLTRADVDALPGFGDAFANADRDGDGRLDRTEFSDAWSYYGAQIANGSLPSSTLNDASAPTAAPAQSATAAQ